MSALEELRTGEIGGAFQALLQRTVLAVGIERNFPPPEGHSRWDRDALVSAANDFLTSPQTPRRLSDLRLRCRTEDALKRQLQEAVKNFFADNGRRTPVGRLVVRFNEVLGAEPGFERRGSMWALKGMSSESVVFDLDAVVGAVGSVALVVPTAWTGKRSGPDVDAASVVRLALAALGAAGGPLRTSDLARVAALRLGLGAAPLSIEATGFDPPSEIVADDVVDDLRAHEVFSLLNDHERVAIGLIGEPVAKLGPILGVSGSKAALIRNRAAGILEEELKEEEGGQLVADLVLQMAKDWTDTWMN